MAKPAKKSVNKGLLTAIAGGQVTHISKEDASPLLSHEPALIEVNTNMLDDQGRAMVRLTAPGQAMLNGSGVTTGEAKASPYAVITNAELPPSKRGFGGRGGAPTVYPFDSLEVGQSFFVPVSEKHPNPVKTLGSTVSSANMRFAQDTGETKIVERAKRGKRNKLELDASGNKIMETKTVPVYKFTRKFSIRAVEAGKSYGAWTAPATGALIARTQ